ncbi:MAG: phosphoenolpyruvate--protein phosphotransferase [Phycisphaerales bacterium]|nr:MAG: phosphoenolpyruvate--protein phosphotransferase [Phycisphaerales bacterium]
MDSERLLCDINELNHLFRESASIETLLDKAVELVAERTQSAVCSIYLYNSEEHVLTLRASRGLNPESVGKVRLRLGQGLTGLALQEMQTIREVDASRNRNYKFFPGIFEERYKAFLALPIARGISKMGVLVLQRDSAAAFTAADITALETAASQLANILENAQFLLGMHEPHQEATPPPPTELKFVKGKIASEGYAYAPAMVIDKHRSLSSLLQRDFDTGCTLADFHKAAANTAAQLESLQERVEHKLSDAASLIFAAHLMILKDKAFIDKIVGRIEGGANPPAAIVEVAGEYIQGFLASDNSYMREKVNDIEDLAIRLVNNLISHSEEIEIHRNHVVVTRTLYPSDLLKLSSEDASAIVLVGGGVTSHISILARSLGMPMIISDTFELLDLMDGTPILLDAEIGNIFIDPGDEILEKFHSQQATRLTLDEQKKLMKPQTVTPDGTTVRLLANINLLTDLKLACALNCDGVGLYRTEFPFIVRTMFPSEAEQYVIYSKLVDSMKGKPVTLRTLDAGGDKILSYYHDIQEQNPAMGMRSIRFSLQNRAIFAEQVRAILRAGADADLRIMFPMISSVDEFCQAKEVVEESIDALAGGGIEHNNHPKLGMMVELPSVVNLIDDFAQEADFFSIGTNDFIQFTLGVDRTNESVADLYLPHHPSILRALHTVVRSAVQNGREISVCGDMAREQKYIPFLLGIGVRALSVDPAYLLRTQQTIAATSISDAEALAQSMLAQSRVRDVAALLEAQTVQVESVQNHFVRTGVSGQS